MNPAMIAITTRKPVSPSAPIRTSARPVGSDGGSMILTIIGGAGGGCTRYCFQEDAVKASSASVRTATPLGPFG